MNTNLTHDTIIALSTPYGVGAIAMVRLSGDQAISFTNNLFQSKFGNKDLNKVASHTIHLGYLRNGDEVLDEVLVSIFKNPHSYTGEDLVEISCHGSTYIQQAIIQLFIENGSRPAEAGEFTLRAFLNGKMDLSQTEAVADLIHSQSAAAKNVALNQLRGGFSSDLHLLKDQLIHFASLIELELDFSEEDVEFADLDQLKTLILETLEHVQKLADSFKLGNAIKNGVNTAIIGKPNSGKSTLLNALLNEERAIVTEIPGTTRDTLEEVLQIEGVLFRIIDTAGLRETKDIIEKMGVERALEKLHSSDVFIYLFDVITSSIQELQNDLRSLPQDIPHLIVGNKSDLINEHEKDKFKDLEKEILFISAKNKESIDNLKQQLLASLELNTIDTSSTIITNARHYDILLNIHTSLNEVLTGLNNNLSGDLLAIDLRQALYYIGNITGEVTSDDILGNVFANFCIGK